MKIALAAAALGAALAMVIVGAPQASAEPGRSGSGPLTEVTGSYRLMGPDWVGTWDYIDPASPLAFTLPSDRSGWVEVRQGGTCVEPSTQETRTATLTGSTNCGEGAPVPQDWQR